MKSYKKLIAKGIVTSLLVLTLSGCAANMNEEELLQGVGASNNVEILSPEEQAESEAAEKETEAEDISIEESNSEGDPQKEEKEKLEAEKKAAKEEKKKACDEISSALKKIVKAQEDAGDFSAYTYNLKTNIYGSYNSHKMQAASLIKVFIAGAVYENWDDIIEQGSSEEELEGLLKSMITVSDNTAANTLIRKLGNGSDSEGMGAVNEYCEEHGYKDTHLGRLLLAPSDQDDNYTSAKDCGRFLRDIYKNKLDGSGEIIHLMKKQERTHKIPSGVPADIETANKTGELADVENDIALIWGNEPYVLCVMTENISGSGNAIDGIRSISSEVYDLWENE